MCIPGSWLEAVTATGGEVSHQRCASEDLPQISPLVVKIQNLQQVVPCAALCVSEKIRLRKRLPTVSHTLVLVGWGHRILF